MVMVTGNFREVLIWIIGMGVVVGLQFREEGVEGEVCGE